MDSMFYSGKERRKKSQFKIEPQRRLSLISLSSDVANPIHCVRMVLEWIMTRPQIESQNTIPSPRAVKSIQVTVAVAN